MSDIMKSIPFPQLLTWIREEYRDKGSVFGVHTPFTAQEEKALTLFDRKLEVPLGPAAGPNSQLAQNIAAAYFNGFYHIGFFYYGNIISPERAVVEKRKCYGLIGLLLH